MQSLLKRRSVLFATLLVGFMLVVISGCSGGGNPNISAAEDALESENYSQALTSVNTAIEEDSANAQAYLLKARILENQASSVQDMDERVELYQQAREAQEQAVQFNAEVRSDVENRRRMTYVQQMQSGIDAFNRAQQSGDTVVFDSAAYYFNVASIVMPDSGSAHLNEAYARVNAGERESAIPALRRAVELSDSTAPNTYQLLGQLYLTSDQADEAISVLQTASQEYPQNDEIQSLLLNAFNQTGNVDQAMQTYQEQIERNPENAVYRYNYGSLLLNAERYEEAIEQLERAVELDAQNPKAYYNLGAAYVNQAVAIDDSIKTIQDSLRANQQDMSSDQQEELNQAVSQLAEQRTEQFRQAIQPLEEAQQLADSGSEYTQDICRALFQAYVQTDQEQKAEGVQECAGYSDERLE